ncbi:MAG: hypothetical protein E7658_04790 [Ruminococcaceae bacterium]|nr:hypothetical protein [Oscillospiraceae bacterium]
MINLENSKELRIKRANTDWWINEKAVVAANGLTYIAYITDMGEIHIKELDAKCSRTPSRDFRLCTLNCDYGDEHNASALCVMKSGKIMVAYTGHGVKELRCRITERPYDISSFSEEIRLPYDGTVTYAQLFENTVKKELWLFSRVDAVNWQFSYSGDEGRTWSSPKTFLHSDSGGLFYLDIRKQDILTATCEDEQWFFALYGHPIRSGDHCIRSGIFTSAGQLQTTSGEVLPVNLYDTTDEKINLADLDTVYDSPEGTTVRLLDVSPTVPPRVGFATFVMDNLSSPSPDKAYYYSATFKNGKWIRSAPICSAGEFLARNVKDGSQSYLGGMAYYYGIGDTGRHMTSNEAVTDRLFIARFDGKDRVLESYLTKDGGETYLPEQLIKRIPGEEGIKIWRPIVPIHAQDNMPVYWHEGTYTAYNAGWHSDAVMYVEFDD